MLVCEEKRQSILLSSENKRLGAGRRSMVRLKSRQRFPRWICQGQVTCVHPSVPVFPNRRQSSRAPPSRHPSDGSCVSPLKGSSTHRWRETSFCAFLGMLEQIVFFRVISFHPKLQTTALWGYSNSGLSRGNLVQLVTWRLKWLAKMDFECSHMVLPSLDFVIQYSFISAGIVLKLFIHHHTWKQESSSYSLPSHYVYLSMVRNTTRRRFFNLFCSI